MSKDLSRRRGTNYLQAAQQGFTETDLALYRAENASFQRSQLAKIHADSVNEVLSHTAETEMRMVDRLSAEAGQSTLKQQIAGSYVSAANRINHGFIGRAFG